MSSSSSSASRILPDVRRHLSTTLAQKMFACTCPSTSQCIVWTDHHNMAWTTIIAYKIPLRIRPTDTRTAPLKPLDNDDMPSSPVPFITPSGLVTFQHDLKARFKCSSLLKLPFVMLPLIKKRSSTGFSLSLKRHSAFAFSRSSSSSDVSASTGSTPTSEMADPMSTTDLVVDSPSETTLSSTPLIGSKIMDRFWPEEEESYPEESRHDVVASHYPVALAPPPHHRRALRSLAPIRELPIGDLQPPPMSSGHGDGPLRFPF